MIREKERFTPRIQCIASLILLCATGCQLSFTPEQVASNADVLADAVVEYVWEVDPEIYFDDEQFAAHDFERRPHPMRSSDYRGNLGLRWGTGLAGHERYAESRVFALDLPLSRWNAQNLNHEESRFPALLCMLVSAKYEADAAVYYFEFFTPRIASEDGRSLVRRDSYVADVRSRSGHAIPVAAESLARELRERGLPLEFSAGIFGINDEFEVNKVGDEFLLGSGRVLVSESPHFPPRRLERLQARVRLGDGVTAHELYDELLTDETVRQALANQSSEMTRQRRNQSQHIAGAQAAEDRQYKREQARRRAARRARMNRAFTDALADGARDLEEWNREQANQFYGTQGGWYGGGGGATSSAQEQREKEKEQRLRREAEAQERKISAAKRQAARERARKAKQRKAEIHSRLEQKVEAFEKKWKDFQRELVFLDRDLKRAEFAAAKRQYAQLEKERDALNKTLAEAELDPVNVSSEERWFELTEQELRRRAEGVRQSLSPMQAPHGEEWREYLVRTIAGVEFYQRVRARKWPDKVVDLAWRVVNKNSYPVWHSLDESAPSSGQKSYLWGGSEIKPGGSHLHVWVTYEQGRSYWKFTGFVRRED